MLWGMMLGILIECEKELDDGAVRAVISGVATDSQVQTPIPPLMEDLLLALCTVMRCVVGCLSSGLRPGVCRDGRHSSLGVCSPILAFLCRCAFSMAQRVMLMELI